MMKQRWGLDRNVLWPTPGDPRGAEQHYWNTGAKENQQLNPGEQLLPGRSMPKYFFKKNQLACSEVSFLLLEINLLLKFDFWLKYEGYPIKWTSDTWCFAGLYLLCGSFQRLRWSTAVLCSWRNLKSVHVIRKIFWKTQSVMIGKILNLWRVEM